MTIFFMCELVISGVAERGQRQGTRLGSETTAIPR